MIIKVLSKTEDFEKVLKLRKQLGISVITLGVLAILAFIAINFSGISIDEYVKGVYSGTGVGFILAGSILLYRTSRILNNETLKEEAEIEERDERNIYIIERAMFLTGIILGLILYVSMLVSLLFNLLVFKTIMCILMLLCFLYISIYFMLKKSI